MSTTSQFFGGSGGGLPPINSAVMLNMNDDVVTIDNATFLRSGVIETNPATYPNAVASGYSVPAASFVQSFSVAAEETSPQDLTFSEDGVNMYVVGSTGDSIDQYVLSTPWDVSTAVFTATSGPFTGAINDMWSISMSPDGTRFVIGADNTELHIVVLSTPFLISTAARTTGITNLPARPDALMFSPNGLIYWYITSYTVYMYQGVVPWAVSGVGSGTLVSQKNLSADALYGGIHGGVFNEDGTAVILVGQTNDTVFQYNMSVPYDVRSIEPQPRVAGFSIAAQEITPTGIAFGAGGTKMYVVGSTSDAVHQYDTSAVGLPLSYSEGSANQYVRVA